MRLSDHDLRLPFARTCNRVLLDSGEGIATLLYLKAEPFGDCSIERLRRVLADLCLRLTRAAGHSPRDLLRVEHHPFSGLSTIVLIIVNILTLAVVVTYGTNVELAAS